MNKAIEESKRYNSEVEYELQAVNTELNNTLQAVLFSGKALRVMKEKMETKRNNLKFEADNLKNNLEDHIEKEKNKQIFKIIIGTIRFVANIVTGFVGAANAGSQIESIGNAFQKNYVPRQ